MPDINPGVAVIISNESMSHFIVQRKDEQHPKLACRGCISLFGGSKEPEEDNLTALKRELFEELKLDGISLNPIPWQTFYLTGNQFAGHYNLHVFTCILVNNEFTKLATQIVAPGVVLEGTGEVLDREQLLKLLDDTNYFVASVDKVLKSYLSNALESDGF